MFAALPALHQQAATAAFRSFLQNPLHPALRSHALKRTRGYRAIYAVRNGVNIWYWIGSHADYDTFTGRK
jgi:hypothetical protein